MTKEEKKEIIARRAAKELSDGDVVNLGIGIPTLVPDYVPEGVHLTLQAENGIIGCGTVTEENIDPAFVIDAGANPAAVAVDGAFCDSFTSFGLMRGGHLDATIMGALEVDEKGNLSNWIIPGKKIFSMGGAMDLVQGAKRVIIAMEHTNRGAHKILKDCSLPYTGVNCVDLIITEMGVMKIENNRVVLCEYHPAFTIEEIQAATGAELVISEKLCEMQI